MKFIRLTYRDGEKFYLNSDMIETFRSIDGVTFWLEELKNIKIK